jgi:Asp-tRNA(Asn)/Glu-tRNA(Gln) amidotransferase A subunit family amidase
VNGLLVQPAVDLLALLSQGNITALELAEKHIRQIEDLNPKLNAIVDFDADRVREQARRLDLTTRSRGPLHGLPVTVKSSISVAGHRCETGSLINKGHTPTVDAEVVARLRAAGAVIIGTTNCPEFLMAYDTENRLYGRTSNPWDLTRTPGGSSGGESAAIAAGLSAGGLGSDSGGSVREPAHFTGICSLKPTSGRIPAHGHLPSCSGPFSILGAIGPMARTMADVDLLFRVLCGPQNTDPVAAPVPNRPISLGDLKQYPIGYFEDDGIVPVTPETRHAIRDAAQFLRGQGFRVEQFRPNALEAARQLWWKFFVRCGWMLLEPIVRTHESELSETFKGFRSIAQADPHLTAEQLLSAWMECDHVRRTLLEEMAASPILLSPVCSVPAFRHGERQWIIDGQNVSYLDAMRYTQWFNLLGAPAAVVPVGRSPEGLPIGLQIAGRPYEDEVVLGIASVLDCGFGYNPPPLIKENRLSSS